VRGMNCYYSNLIEGHDTLPVDIERAMRADLATEPRRRDLQIVYEAQRFRQALVKLTVALYRQDR
jgi:ribosomal protein L20